MWRMVEFPTRDVWVKAEKQMFEIYLDECVYHVFAILCITVIDMKGRPWDIEQWSFITPCLLS